MPNRTPPAGDVPAPDDRLCRMLWPDPSLRCWASLTGIHYCAYLSGRHDRHRCECGATRKGTR